MERMYQRTKIQEESMQYETKKHTGEIPIIGVNSFVQPSQKNNADTQAIFRSSSIEQNRQIENLAQFKKRNQSVSAQYLKMLQKAALENDNIFSILIEAIKYCSLGEISNALYQVGGKYSRNL
jgi:methylmalonyl-CoA mutase